MGGVVEVYKPYIENGYYYDVNSLYPAAMCGDIPVGHPRWTNHPDIDDPSVYGFIEATVHVKESVKFPVLPYRLNNKVISPTGVFRGWWYSEELRLAIKLNQLESIQTH